MDRDGGRGRPSALVIWVIAALGLFVPLVFTVLELSSRYPEEGGIYVWSKRAFGPFAAFITGWTYWGSNLPYLPGAPVFRGGQRAVHRRPVVAGAVDQQHLLHRRVDGRPRPRRHAERRRPERREVAEQRRRDRELDSRGVLLIALGAVSWSRFGSATPMTPRRSCRAPA